MRKIFYFVAILFLASCAKQEQSFQPENAVLGGNSSETVSGTESYSGYEIVPNEAIIRFKSESTEGQRNTALAALSANVIERIHTNAMKRRGDKEGIFLIRTSLNAVNAINKGKSDNAIEFIEPNYVYQHTALTNDTYFANGSLWGLGNTSSVYGSNAATAWAAGKTGSRTVYVGIIDEGVMNTHEDLGANFGVNPFETVGNGVDDDGNGLIDDVYGWDFDGNNNTIFDGATDDHGTHVAGTIGALANNGKGVVGVNWNVSMLSAKFLGKRGGTTANAIKAVDYFTDLKNKGLNIVATNNSWGGGGFSQALQDAIERANTAGILFIAAAGNSSVNIDASASYPAAYPNSNIITVAALTSSGALASYSNFGATMVDIGAPGSGIWSTIPKSVKGAVISSYASYNGTSMATPHVTGACALYASIYPGSSTATIKAAILNSATPTQSLSGKVLTGGRLNVAGF